MMKKYMSTKINTAATAPPTMTQILVLSLVNGGSSPGVAAAVPEGSVVTETKISDPRERECV